MHVVVDTRGDWMVAFGVKCLYFDTSSIYVATAADNGVPLAANGCCKRRNGVRQDLV